MCTCTHHDGGKGSFEVDGRRELRAPTMAITGSGALPEGAEATVVRRLDDRAAPAGVTLTGTWDGRPEPALLAYAGTEQLGRPAARRA